MVIDNNPCFNDPSWLGMRVPSAATLAVLTGHGECSPSSTDPIPHPVLLITRNCLAALRDPPLPKREVLVHVREVLSVLCSRKHPAHVHGWTQRRGKVLISPPLTKINLGYWEILLRKF